MFTCLVCLEIMHEIVLAYSIYHVYPGTELLKILAILVFQVQYLHTIAKAKKEKCPPKKCNTSFVLLLPSQDVIS